MKTKIIYISGNEIFEMADIRAAFEEVRDALGLDSDTVLFGVPVDSDDAIANEESEIIIQEPVVEEVIEEEPAPVKKTKKAATKKAQTVIEEKIEEPVIIEEAPVEEPAEEEKIIPILSILSSKGEDIIEESAQEDEEEIDTIKIETVAAQTITITDDIVTTETVSISDVITDEMPEATEEKTLEQLLEKMAPLREDNIVHQAPAATELVKPEIIVEPEIATDDEIDLDATLEQLATEFATKQDDIEPTPKAESGGKIGKLKNILPFKKAKREESGLMSDLFGWAGIAANDDEFSIPGFFTTASKK